MTLDPSPDPRVRTSDAVRDTFDEWVRTGKADGMERRHKRLAELMLERVDLPADARILDVGCGDGWAARMLSPHVPEGAVIGIDVSVEMILRARRSCRDSSNVLFAPAEAETIPWAEEYFTHILSIESAYYWSDPSRAAREMYRVTTHGGAFHILINYYSENPFSDGWETEMGLRLHRLSSPQWAGIFQEAGFGEVSTERIPDDSPISPGKTAEQLARREGLQRVGALYITGRKPKLPRSQRARPRLAANPFRILRRS